MNPSITLIIVDDHEVVRQGVRAYLSAQPDLEVAGQAGDGLEALTLARDVKPALIIMDINMPKLDGFEVLERAWLYLFSVYVMGRDRTRVTRGLPFSGNAVAAWLILVVFHACVA